jgi:HAD superfamily phosphoserine phosphatase-like hydrolase
MASVVLTTLEDKINKSVFNRVISHKKKGHLVVVVSGSPEFLLKPFCNKWELKLIGTELEVVDGILTGKIKNEICLGKNKVFRLEQKLGKLSQFENIYAYGDGRGDTAMLQLPNQDKRFYKEQLNFLKEL